MTTARDFLEILLRQRGDRYIFGAEVDLGNPNPPAFDCSELIQWGGARAGISPPIPDGAYYQWRQAQQLGLIIPVAEAIKTPGTLLYMGDGTGVGRDAITHVAASLGDGYTIEARGKKWGVGVWSATRGFDYASKVPGIIYGRGTSVPDNTARTQLGLGDEGPDVEFVQALFNIVIPELHKAGFTDGNQLNGTSKWDNATASVNKSFESFWNKKGPGKMEPLQQDTIFTMKGTAPALADLVAVVQSQNTRR